MRLNTRFYITLLVVSLISCSKEESSQEVEVPERLNYRNISYASSSEAQKMDIYLPKGEGPFPVVFVIHGGAFKAGDKSTMLPYANDLVNRGFVACSINYRLSTEAVFPAAVHDTKAAVRYIRNNANVYKINPSKIGAWGVSAGAYLASILGTSSGEPYLEGTEGDYPTTSTAIQACVDWFAPIDFARMTTEALTLGFNISGQNESQFLGVDVNDPNNLPIVNQANPTSYIDSNDPPFLIQHGTEDQLIPFTQSSNFYHALIDQLVESQVSYDLIEGAGHGGGLFVNQTNLEKVFSFLNMHLK
tara:strand:+ start:11154 stop:12062 length:909 start_codon:yes stop_codon:yes gene_type:complete